MKTLAKIIVLVAAFNLIAVDLSAKPGSGAGGYSRPSAPSSRPSMPSSRPSTPSYKPSPSRPSSPSPSYKPSPTPKSSPAPKPNYTPPPTPAPKPKSTKPTNQNFDSAAGKAKQKQESRQTFQQTQSAPKPKATPNSYKKTVVGADGKKSTVDVKINKDAPSTKKLQETSHTQQSTRSERSRTVVYNNYYGHSYPSAWNGYHDGISPWFWLWLMNQSSQSQAQYVYNHQQSLDQSRINELYAKNASLKAEVEAMKGKPVNSDYVPPEIGDKNYDLMYSDEHVKAVAGGNGFWTFVKVCFYITLTVSVIGGLIWLIFIKRW